jgi:hypothetical protein
MSFLLLLLKSMALEIYMNPAWTNPIPVLLNPVIGGDCDAVFPSEFDGCATKTSNSNTNFHCKINHGNGHSGICEPFVSVKICLHKPKYYIERNSIVLKKKLRWCRGFNYCKLPLSSCGSFVLKPQSPVKHFALSRRRSRVQIPAGALLF